MILELNFSAKGGKNNNTVTLVLKNGKKIIDSLDFEFDRNLDEVLIASIDKILEKNKIDILSLKKAKIIGKWERNSLSHQVAKTFIKGLNLGNYSQK